MNKEEILSNACVPKAIWGFCYIDDDGKIYVPEYDENGNIILTGEESYQKFINGDIRTEEEVKTTEEKIEYILKEMENLQTKQAEYQEILAGLMFEDSVNGEVVE